MSHNCEFTSAKKELTFVQKEKIKFRELITISVKNPCHFNIFKSNKAVKKEQNRHRRINPYAIHPFSIFRGRYEIYLTVLYTGALIAQPLSTFLPRGYHKETLIFRELLIMFDLLCWFDIVMTFFSGFVKERNHVNTVELRFPAIARNYLFSRYFICDVLSSAPVEVSYYPGVMKTDTSRVIFIFLNILKIFKLLRIAPLLTYIYNSAYYLGFMSKSVPFVTCVSLISILTVHWATCVQFILPRVHAFYYPSIENKTWVYRYRLFEFNFFARYNHAFLKASAYILGIRQDMYTVETNMEYFVGLFTYLVGKIFVAVVWLILAMAILNSRTIHFKFVALMDEMGEFMKRKQLPPSLSDRLSQYYYYKYQNKYFNDNLLKSFLPDNIKSEVKIHICKTIIKNVSLFFDLSSNDISAMVDYLKPEIFLPTDTIIQHGTIGDAMYFLLSGTVAVFTRSGKEICHLQDGAFFGEVSLILPNHTRYTTIVALEISVIYRLDKRDFDRYLLKNKHIMHKIMKEAEERLKLTLKVEDEYKQYMFEQTFGFSKMSPAEYE